MRVLGVHDGHNAAACLYVDGEVRAALQEERLTRVKNWAGFPSGAAQWVLSNTRVAPADVDFVAVNGYHAAFPMTREQLMAEYEHINDLAVTMGREMRRAVRGVAAAVGTLESYRAKRQADRVRELTAMGIPQNKIVFVEHHTAHASAAYYGWGNFTDDVLVLTADGSGDGICASVSIGRKGRLERLHAVPMAQSLGNIYAMVTFLMGMVPLEHEYKLMGLAPYADPKGAERVCELLTGLIRFDPRSPLGWEKVESCPETYCSYRFFRDLLERQRFDWVAGGLQRFTENIIVQWVRNCVRETGVRKVALSGGVFMNVKANKLIMEMPEVEDLFVYPSCGDESNSMGAAYWVFAQHGPLEAMKPLRDVYFGRQFTDDEIEEALRRHKFQGKVHFERMPDIAAAVARLLAGGEVVARHAGREEFGARALGNRSVLANASRPGVIRIINEAIKSRDFWMPFATSVMAEREADYIINPKRVRAPYMILSFDTTDRRSEITAGIHPYDYTVRPQVVDECWNPGYHRVISEFSALTGIGAVLNTSLNLHGFPITSSPADSLDVLDRSGLQNLALENWLVRKA